MASADDTREDIPSVAAPCPACTPADGIMVSCDVEGPHERHRGTYVHEFAGAEYDAEVSWLAGEPAERDGETPASDTCPDLPSAAEIVRYMRSAGWTHGRQGSHGAMWTKGDVEFSVPHEDDRPSWLREVVGRLASAEGRTPEETAAVIAAYRDARAATKPCGCGPVQPCREHLGCGAETDAGVSVPDDSGRDSPGAPEQARDRTGADVRECAAALERVRKLAAQWASLAGAISVAPAAAEVDAMIGRRMLDVIHGDPGDPAMRVQRLTVMAESWLVPGASLFYPAAGQAVLDAIRGASTETEASWRERAERAEAKLAEVEAHTSAIVDALRHALAYIEHVPGPSAQAAAERYRSALAVTGTGEEPS